MNTSKTKSPPQKGLSVNALSRLTGADRRTIDKAVVGIKPVRRDGKTRFYLLADVEAALKAKPSTGLKDEKLREEIRKLRIANDAAEGLVIEKGSVVASIQRLSAAICPLLRQKLMNEYPAAVSGMDVAEAREYGGRLYDAIMRDWASFAGEWK